MGVTDTNRSATPARTRVLGTMLAGGLAAVAQGAQPVAPLPTIVIKACEGRELRASSLQGFDPAADPPAEIRAMAFTVPPGPVVDLRVFAKMRFTVRASHADAVVFEVHGMPGEDGPERALDDLRLTYEETAAITIVGSHGKPITFTLTAYRPGRGPATFGPASCDDN